AVVAGIGLASELGGLTTGARLDRRRILEIATDFEGHPDNAAPAIFGGLTISLSEPARTWQVPVRTIDEVTVLIPDVRLDTDVARSLIPAVIDHDIAAENSARSGLLVHGLVNDPSALFEATSDKLHQEFRRSVYPGSMALVDRLRGHGLAAVVAGAGPPGLVRARPGPGAPCRLRRRAHRQPPERQGPRHRSRRRHHGPSALDWPRGMPGERRKLRNQSA